ncbi:MAG: transketolase [Epulopiscium sp. Nele67-Bin002]|nr:MAG: transketolase [Epulopiscium sp. Nuni2H_MBin001]OON92203.1 MAG: transketolase [Epulopiscium sp. Nele67-Bin002]OON93308.1 MAG: transketolase [Epulopiscium sp. Nele67-Bin001]
MPLDEIANEMRKCVIEGVYRAKSGHPGGSLSICDILAVLFFEQMNIDPKNPKNPDRDRFVLSKGHAAPALYSALATRGFFPASDIKTLRNIDSYLQGHPCMNKIPGVDMSTGSLGQGLSAANGMAMIAKHDKKDFRVYVVCGDGEIQEGQIWEAAMTAAHYKLDNLTLFVDVNGLQIDGPTTEVMGVGDVAKKFDAFGFNAISIDGHDLDQIRQAIETAKQTKGKPTAVICNTTKGKGVSYMENQLGFHGAAPNDKQYEIAMEELGGFKS